MTHLSAFATAMALCLLVTAITVLMTGIVC